MARTIADIISFHWEAARASAALGSPHARLVSACRSIEFSLRFLPAYAGVLTVPLSWALLRRIAPEKTAWRLLTTVLIATSPVLTLYAQEARMYSLVVLLAVASTYLATRLIHRSTTSHTVVYVLVNWAMLGLQYYFVLLIAAHGLLPPLSLCDTCDAAFLRPGGDACRRRFSGSFTAVDGPSPGFHETVAVVFEKQANRSRHWSVPCQTLARHQLWRLSLAASTSPQSACALPLFMIRRCGVASRFQA